MRRRLCGLGGAVFSLVEILGGFAEVRLFGDGPMTFFYGLVWVWSLHELFGRGPRRA